MKLLFVGEGVCDVGLSDKSPNQPRPGGGVIPLLVQKLNPKLDTPVSALLWTDIVLLGKRGKKRGLAVKVAAAMLLGLKHGFAGSILVCDRDHDSDRLTDMERGAADFQEKASVAHPAVCGVAKESVEAWTLGAPSALAAELGVELSEVTAVYMPSRVEELYENSGKPEKRPKALLEKVAQLKHRKSDNDLRVAVAERTDVEELQRNCPLGFAPFAEKVKQAFGERGL